MMTPANYHRAVKRLEAAEREHRANLERLADALERREAGKVPPLRRDCEKTERALIDALQAAHQAHRSYWQARCDALRPELDAAAVLIAEFNACARAAGDLTTNPALSYLQNRAIVGITGENVAAQGVLSDADGVPTDAPDSALIEDQLGVWR